MMTAERAEHLNVCPSNLCTQEFFLSVEELEKWLCLDHTHPEIALWVLKYLRA
jgi:hypothetical protein